MSRTLIIPGLDGSPEPHWQHWWAATDPNALMVHQDSWHLPTPEAWEAEVAGAILQHPGSVLVAHSLGCITVARLLQTWPQLNVAGVLMVAPADTRVSKRISQFGPVVPQPLGVPAVLVASRNDPWMRYEQAQALAEGWQAELVDLGHAGHINVESGFGPWLEGLRLRDRINRRASLRGPSVRHSHGQTLQRRAF